MTRSQLLLTLIALLFVAAAIWYSALRRIVHTPEAILKRMHCYQLNGLEPYLAVPLPTIEANEFRRSTGGLLGLWRRWRNARGWVKICEFALEHGTADVDDLNRMKRHASIVASSSLLSLLEAMVGVFTSRVSAAQGLTALQAYWRMSQDIYSITSAEGFRVGTVSVEPFL